MCDWEGLGRRLGEETWGRVCCGQMGQKRPRAIEAISIHNGVSGEEFGWLWCRDLYLYLSGLNFSCRRLESIEEMFLESHSVDNLEVGICGERDKCLLFLGSLAISSFLEQSPLLFGESTSWRRGTAHPPPQELNAPVW